MWKEENWEKLWDDLCYLIKEKPKPEEHKRHFLGSIVCLEQQHVPGKIHTYQVIDGQQRLVTLSILLCAIRDAALKGNNQNLANQIQKIYLVDEFGIGEEKYKIFPRLRDREDYLLLAEKPNNEKQKDETIKNAAPKLIHEAYKYFINSIQKAETETKTQAEKQAESLLPPREEPPFDLIQLFTALTDQTDFVLITLKKENPFSIFKSLNSTGVDLEQGDLIRNHIFMSVPIEQQDDFDDKQWRKLEEHFQTDQKLNGTQFTDFFKDTLMSKGNYVGEQNVHEEFATHYPIKQIDPQQIVLELIHKAKQYNIVLGKTECNSKTISQALKKINGLYATTAYPLILHLFDMHHDKNQLEEQDLAILLNLIAGFILRRHVCKESSRGYGRWFCAASKNIRNNPKKELEDFLKSKGWPNDETFTQSFKKMNLYKSNYSTHILQSIENYIQSPNEQVSLNKCSIEHIMPQTITEEWKTELGTNWETIHKQYLHTPGNLTLVGQDYNISMKNDSFQDKKRTLKNSKVYLNQYFIDINTTWNEKAIENRGEELAQIAAKIWAGPEE